MGLKDLLVFFFNKDNFVILGHEGTCVKLLFVLSLKKKE